MVPAPPPPPTDPDELASAIVDGQLPADVAERARRDPAIARRVEEMQAVRAALRTPPPPPAAGRERAIDAALAAFDDARPPLRAVPQPGRPRRWPSPAPWLAAAAAVLVVLGLLAAGLLDREDDQDTAAQTAEVDQVPVEPGEGGSEESGAGDADAEANQPSSVPGQREPADDSQTRMDADLVPDLGPVASPEEMESAVADRFTGTAPSQSESEVLSEEPSAGAATTCPGVTIAGDPGRGVALFAANASYRESPVVVHVYEQDGEQRLVATDYSCTDVVDVPFEP